MENSSIGGDGNVDRCDWTTGFSHLPAISVQRCIQFMKWKWKYSQMSCSHGASHMLSLILNRIVKLLSYYSTRMLSSSRRQVYWRLQQILPLPTSQKLETFLETLGATKLYDNLLPPPLILEFGSRESISPEEDHRRSTKVRISLCLPENPISR